MRAFSVLIIKACQFHPSYCPEAKGTPPEIWDTSHDLSVITEHGERRKIGTFQHADWAQRVGELIEQHGLDPES